MHFRLFSYVVEVNISRKQARDFADFSGQELNRNERFREDYKRYVYNMQMKQGGT